jgi:hypothetical protein
MISWALQETALQLRDIVWALNVLAGWAHRSGRCMLGRIFSDTGPIINVRQSVSAVTRIQLKGGFGESQGEIV